MFDPVQSTRYHRAIQSLTLPITLLFLCIGINSKPQIALFVEDYKENPSLWNKVTTIHEIFGPNPVQAEHLTLTDYCPDLESNSDTVDSELICIWGHIYYQGRPVEGARVVVKLGHEEIQTTTNTYDHDLEPYYRVYLPPSDGEPLHITASFAKQSVTQSFQYINTISTLENGFSLGLISKGRWKLWYLNLRGVNTLAATQDKDFLLTGSSEGLTQIPFNTSSHRALSQPDYNLFSDTEIRDLIIDPWGEVWIVTAGGIAIWEESSWLFIDDPIADGIEWEALISHPDTGDLWAGGKRNDSNQGEIVFYDKNTDSWSHFAALEGPVTTLAIDTQKHLWAGTWGSGLYEYNLNEESPNEEWTLYLADDGLPSDFIHVVYAQPQTFIPDKDRSYLIDRAIWVGTAAGDANNLGGIGRYHPSQNIWKSYDVAHGLPSQQNSLSDVSETQDDLPEKTVGIYDILIDSRDGLVWAGTEEGLYIFSDETEGQERWSLHDPGLQGQVRTLIFIQESLIVATATNLQRLISPTSNSENTFVQSPSISISPYRRNGKIELYSGLPYDQTSDSWDQEIIAWHWESDLDGLFCTDDLTCPLTHLGPGLHQITLQRQNRYGTWLSPSTIQLELGHTTYLPIYK